MAGPVITAQGPQPAQGDESAKGHLKVIAAVGGIGAAGFIPTGGGRIWDHYLRAIRSAETVFPGAILRTFRVSETLSPFETWGGVGVSAEQMGVGGKYAEFLRNRFGPGIQDVSLTRTGTVFGEITSGGQPIGMGLRIKAGTQRGTAIADYFARITGTDMPIKGIGGATATASLNESLLRAEYLSTRPPVPYGAWVEAMAPHMRTRDLIIGARYRDRVSFLGMDIMLDEKMRRHVARAETFAQLMRARAAATAGRLNILLSKPLEIPVIGNILNKIPVVRSMAVQPGSALQMAGRYTGKALALGAMWKGLEYYDYARSQGGVWPAALGTTGGAAIGAFMFKGAGRRFSPVGAAVGAGVGLYTALSPRFDSGLFHGVASTFADASITRASISEKTGMSESLRRQEAITPGLISVKTALGFAGVGGLVGGMAQYGGLVRASLAKQAKIGGNFADIVEGLREVRAAEFGEKLWGSGIGKKIARMPFGKTISSKVRSPVTLGLAAGIAAWGVLSSGTSLLSGNFEAAIPVLNLLGTKETPEELRETYSGEREVPIRKGRLWEFGRCLSDTSLIPISHGARFKEAQQVVIGDNLVDRQGRPTKVTKVFKRNHHGKITKFKTRANWVIDTKLTSDHIVPVLRRGRIVEIKAKDLLPGTMVEVPIPKLPENVISLDAESILATDLFLVYQDRIFPAQTNWYNAKIQRSHGFSIPKTILLTPELGRLFGYFLAEGNLSYKDKVPHMIETVHAKSERWIVDDIIAICEKEFNIRPTVRFKKGKKAHHDGCWIVRICSTLLGRIFLKLFYDGSIDSDKRFPVIFMHTPKEFKSQLIEGYWIGDGHLDYNTHIISSCRREFLDAIYVLLLAQGEYPTIAKFEQNDFRGRHRLRWTPNFKSSFYHWQDGHLFCEICSIESEDYNGTVYDFEVDNPDHLFQAGTFLVHNSSGYEGGRIEYFRPHMLARLKERSYQKGIYGSEEERWKYDPTLHPLKALLGSDEWKYHYEIEHQYERPAPLTSTYGEDVPFIGPLVAATFGKLVKPRKMVRPEEWNLGNGNYTYLPDIRGETEPAYDLGGLGPGAPVAPEEPTQLMNELIYRRREAVGLVGYAENVVQKAATGREEPFKNLQTIETMGKETGGEYWLWKHLNVGGALGTSEPVRRFIPHTRSYLETYNPLANTMPSWIPEDYFMDLAHGNPFTKLPEAEMRLPGPGYASLHPELEGVAPEDYPLAHRVKILGDVAMWSKEYENALSKAKRNLNTLSDHDKSLVLATEAQTKAKKGSRREITPYRFRPELLTTKEVTVSNILDPRRIQTKETGDAVIELQGFGAITNMQKAMEFAKDKLKGKLTLQLPAMESRQYNVGKNFSSIKAVAMMGNTDYGQEIAKADLAEADGLRGEFEQLRFTPAERLAGKISEAALHNIETPLEMLTPVSPAAKLIRQRSAIEEYIASEAVGTGNAFWDRPVENFLRPAANMALKKIGFDAIPADIRKRRDINEYFDMLAWTKSKKAERLADQNGDRQAAIAAKTNQQETLFGLDVFGSPMNVMKALPRRERDFYEAFSNAPTAEERAQIFALIPENEQRVYLSAWVKQEEEAAQAKKNSKIATQADEKTIIAAQMMRSSEGFGSSDDLEAEWMKETGGQMPFDEWIREKKAAKYFSTHSLPGADWLGWHPSVDMEDVKLKYVEMQGMDHHDFDLWGARKKSLARKPYISEDLIEQMGMQANFNEVMKTRANAKAIAGFYGSKDGHATMSYISAPMRERYNIEISDSREGMVQDAYKRLGAR